MKKIRELFVFGTHCFGTSIVSEIMLKWRSLQTSVTKSWRHILALLIRLKFSCIALIVLTTIHNTQRMNKNTANQTYLYRPAVSRKLTARNMRRYGYHWYQRQKMGVVKLNLSFASPSDGVYFVAMSGRWYQSHTGGKGQFKLDLEIE